MFQSTANPLSTKDSDLWNAFRQAYPTCPKAWTRKACAGGSGGNDALNWPLREAADRFIAVENGRTGVQPACTRYENYSGGSWEPQL